jgi:general secretion pathway protein A
MYNEFYSFSEKPFELLPDPKFLFLTTSHRKIMASVMDGIRKRRGFVSITGEVGTGKTTLIRYLLGKFEYEEKIKTVFIFHPTITFQELLKNILLELDLEVIKDSKGALLRQLNDYLIQMSAKDETLVIIIDEAQDLSKEVMGEFGMLPKSASLQIVSVGQPEFEGKLNSQGLRQLKQRIEIKHQLRVFSEEESKDYINHRLRLVRSSSFETFTPKAISMICSHARGIPRLINLICDNAFLTGYSLSQKKIDVDIIREVIEDMEAPFLRKALLSPIVTKASLIVLSLLCLGGLVFGVDRYFQPRPAKSPYVDTKPSSTSPPPQKLMEQISGSNTLQGLVELKPTSPEFPKPASQPNAPLTLMSEEDKSTKIVTAKKGHTLSYLTEKYYGMINNTLIDLILDSNPEIKDVDLILVNQKIKIPKITNELLTMQPTDHAYKIQVGTFQTPDFVRFYRNEPVLKGREIKIFPRKVSPKETWYRVVVGPFGNKDECLRVIDQLKEKGLLPVFGGILKME